MSFSEQLSHGTLKVFATSNFKQPLHPQTMKQKKGLLARCFQVQLSLNPVSFILLRLVSLPRNMISESSETALLDVHPKEKLHHDPKVFRICIMWRISIYLSIYPSIYLSIYIYIYIISYIMCICIYIYYVMYVSTWNEGSMNLSELNGVGLQGLDTIQFRR